MKSQHHSAKSPLTGITLAALVMLTTAAATAPADTIQPFTASKAVDLTHSMHDEMAFWPGGVPFKKDRLVNYDTGGYQLHQFTMGENTGTHVDAPSHFIEGSKSIDRLALDQLILPIVVLDAKAASADNNDYELTPEDIRNWEAEHGRVPANALFVMNTGWHNRFDNPTEYINMDADEVMHFPGFSPDAAQLLVERDVAGIGIDTLSLDHGPSTTFATHVVMLKANKYQVENMASLDLLPATGATAVIGVLPVRDGSQAQARIFALLP